MARPSKLWYLHRVKKMNLQEIAKKYGLTKQKVYREIREHRIERGDVVISKAWMLDRIQEGKTPQQMADEAFCYLKTIYNKAYQFGIKLRPLTKTHYKSVTKTKL